MSRELSCIEYEEGLNHRRTFISALTALLILALANGLLLALELRAPPSPEDTYLAAKLALAGPPSGGQPNWDWLLVGDSSGGLGVDSGLLGDRLGGTCLNAATFGNMGLSGDIWMVEHFLRHHPTPRGVIVVHAANTLSQPINDAFFHHVAAIPRPFHETFFAVLPEVPNGHQWLTLFRARGYLPLLLVKDHLRISIQWNSANLSDHVGSEERLKLSFNGTHRLGAERADAVKVRNAAADYFDSDKETNGRFDAHHTAALERLVDLAETHGFRLIFANGPIADAVRSHPDFADNISAVDMALKQTLSNRRNVHHLLKDWFSLPDEKMENANHPTGTAIDEYTNALADAIIQTN